MKEIRRGNPGHNNKKTNKLHNSIANHENNSNYLQQIIRSLIIAYMQINNSKNIFVYIESLETVYYGTMISTPKKISHYTIWYLKYCGWGEKIALNL